MNLFQTGNFQLHSGEQSSLKIECDALTPDDWQTFAQLIYERVPPFRQVFGIPFGGNIIATWLRPFATLDEAHPYLLVDDVLTTGGSMRTGRKRMFGPDDAVIGAVVFARRPVQEEWITALFTMSEAR